MKPITEIDIPDSSIKSIYNMMRGSGSISQDINFHLFKGGYEFKVELDDNKDIKYASVRAKAGVGFVHGGGEVSYEIDREAFTRTMTTKGFLGLGKEFESKNFRVDANLDGEVVHQSVCSVDKHGIVTLETKKSFGAGINASLQTRNLENDGEFNIFETINGFVKQYNPLTGERDAQVSAENIILGLNKETRLNNTIDNNKKVIKQIEETDFANIYPYEPVDLPELEARLKDELESAENELSSLYEKKGLSSDHIVSLEERRDAFKKYCIENEAFPSRSEDSDVNKSMEITYTTNVLENGDVSSSMYVPNTGLLRKVTHSSDGKLLSVLTAKDGYSNVTHYGPSYGGYSETRTLQADGEYKVEIRQTGDTYYDLRKLPKIVSTEEIHLSDVNGEYSGIVIIHNYDNGEVIEYIYDKDGPVGRYVTDSNGNSYTQKVNDSGTGYDVVSTSDSRSNTGKFSEINVMVEEARQNPWRLNPDDSEISRNYKAISGDTISTVMERMGLDSYDKTELAAFAKVNNIEDVNKIGVGKELQNPFFGLDQDEKEFAANNIINAEAQSDADMLEQEGDGTGYERNSIVGFDADGPITAEQAGLWKEEVGIDVSENDKNDTAGGVDWAGKWDSVSSVAVSIKDAQDNLSLASHSYHSLKDGDYAAAVKSAAKLANEIKFGGVTGSDTSKIGHAADLYASIDDGSALGVASAGLGLLSDYNVGGSQLGGVASAVSLFNDIDNGDIKGAVDSAVNLASSFGMDIGEGAGQAYAAYKMFDSIKDGDYLGAAQAGLAVFGPPGAAAAVQIGSQLLEGDVEGAAISAVTTALMYAPIPGQPLSGIILGLIAQELLGSLLGSPPPDPEAWLDFSRDENGNIIFTTDANETGSSLQSQLDNIGNPMAEYLLSIEQGLPDGTLPDNKFNFDWAPQIRMWEDYEGKYDQEWRFVGGRNIPDTVSNGPGVGVDISEVMDYMRFMMLVTHTQESWLVDTQSDGSKVYDPYGLIAAAKASLKLGGTTYGQVIGGGNVEDIQKAQRTNHEDVKVIEIKETPTPIKNLYQLMNTHVIPTNLFSGESGKLLALALGAGTVTLSEYAASKEYLDFYKPEDINLFDDARYQALVDEADNVIFAGIDNSSSQGLRPDYAIDQGNGYEIDYSDSLTQRHDVYAELNNEALSAASSSDNVSTLTNNNISDKSLTLSDQERADLFSITGPLFNANPEGIVAGEFVEQETLNELDVANLGNGQGDVGLPEQPNPVIVEPDKEGKSDYFEVLEDRSLVVSIADLLANDGLAVSALAQDLNHESMNKSNLDGVIHTNNGMTFLRLGDAVAGTVGFDENGRVEFTPEANYNDFKMKSEGSLDAGFFYYAENSLGEEEKVWVDVAVAAVDDLVDAVDDDLTMQEDGILNLSALLDNDYSVDNDALRLAGVNASVGEVYQEAGEWYYKPPANYSGDAQLTYVVSDDDRGFKSSARANVLINDDGIDAPIVNVDDLTAIIGFAKEEQIYQFNAQDLLANDLTSDGQRHILLSNQSPLSVVSIALKDASLGSVAYNSETGEINFVPAENVNGNIEFIYQVDENNLGVLAQGSVSLIVENTADEFSAQSINGHVVIQDTVTIFSIEDLIDMAQFINEDAIDLNGDDVISNDLSDVALTAARMIEDIDVNHGLVRRLDDNQVQFIPEPGYHGPVSFEVRLHNGFERIDVRLDMNVIPSFVVSEDEMITIDANELLIANLNPNANDNPIEQSNLQNVSNVWLSESQSHLGELTYDNSTQTISFRPNENVNSDLNGKLDLHYSVINDSGEIQEYQTALIVKAENDTPIVTAADIDSVTEDNTLVINKSTLLASGLANGTIFLNDLGEYTDLDGETLSISNVMLLDDSAGELTVLDNGDVEYKPNKDYQGNENNEVEFTYQVNDGIKLGEVVTSRFAIESVNDAPELVSNDERIELNGVEGQAINDSTNDLAAQISFNVSDLLKGMQDAEGDEFSISSISLQDVNQGTLEWVDTTGEVIFTSADRDFNGEVKFDYSITDTQGKVAQFSDKLTIGGVNDTVQFTGGDVATTVEDTAVIITKDSLFANGINKGTVLLDAQGNYVDVDGEVLSITNIKLINTTAGELSLLENGDVEYKPSQDYLGNDDGQVEFSYQISDGVVHSDAITSTISIEPLNDAPVASGAEKRYEGLEGQSTTIRVSDLLLGSQDTEGDEYAISDVRLADETQGALSFNRELGTVVFTPAENFIGDVGLDYDLREIDSQGDFTDVKTTGSANIIIRNSDEDDFALENRELRLIEGQATVLTGGFLLQEYAKANLDDLSGKQESGITELDGQLLQITKVSVLDLNGNEANILISNLDLAIGENGQSIIVTPGADFSTESYGSAINIMYTVTDGVNNHDVTINTTIAAVNDVPIGIDHELVDGVEEQLYTIDAQTLLVGSSDEEGEEIHIGDIRLNSLDGDEQNTLFQTKGEFNVVRDELGQVIKAEFIPAENYYGEVSFSYDLVDASGNISTHEASLDIINENDTAEVTDKGYWNDKEWKNQQFNIDEDTVAIYSREALLDTLVDVDGETLNITHVELLEEDKGKGIVELQDDGQVKFSPAQDYHGDVSFKITVDDGVSPVDAKMTVRVWGVNDAPALMSGEIMPSYEVLEEHTLVIDGNDILEKLIDEDNDEIRIVGISGANNGTAFYDVEANSLIYNPENDYYGDATIKVMVEDSHGAAKEYELSVDVLNTDDPIKAFNDEVHVLEDENNGRGRVFDIEELLGNDYNPDQTKLRIVDISEESIEHGEIKLLSDGRVQYIANEAEYNGTQEFTYTVEDEAGNQSKATVRLVVDEVNDKPVFLERYLDREVNEDESITINLQELIQNNTFDIEDDWLHLDAVALVDDHGQNIGQVEWNEFTNEVTYTPSEHFNSQLMGPGQIVPQIKYLVSDERGASEWGYINIDVKPINDAPVANINGKDDILFVWGDGQDDGLVNEYGNPTDESAFFNNDAEYDEEELFIDRVEGATAGNGVVEVSSNGIVTYRANDGVNSGSDTFRYRLTDKVTHEKDGSVLDYESADWGTVQVEIIENHPPITIGSISGENIEEDQKAVFSFDQIFAAVYDQDLGHQQLPERLKIVDFIDEQYGKASIVDGQVVFEAIDHFNTKQFESPASFSVVVEDIVGHQTVVPVSMVYTQKGDAPVPQNIDLGQPIKEDGEGLTFTIRDLLKGVEDVDKDLGSSPDDYTLLKESALGVASGAGSLNKLGEWFNINTTSEFTEEDYQKYLDNEIHFTPSQDYDEDAIINYTVVDRFGLEGSATAKIDIIPVNDNPTTRIITSNYTILDDDWYRLDTNILDVSNDVDGDDLKIEVRHSGKITDSKVAGNGDIMVRGKTGDGSVEYRVVDGNGGETPWTSFDVKVNHMPRPPIIADSIELELRAPVNFDGEDVKFKLNGRFLAYDPDGDITQGNFAVQGTENAIWEMRGQGGFFLEMHTYQKDGYSGRAPVTFVVEDQDGFIVHKEFHINFKANPVDGSFSFDYVPVSGNKNIDGPNVNTSLSSTTYGHLASPIVIDLNGNGLNLVGVNESNAFFDWDNDGDRDRTGWVGKGDGLLAFDHDGDGKISQKSEIAFVDYLEEAKTDLEGLRYFDTDGDGFFTANDDDWEKFGVWEDIGSDGHDDGTEFIGLDEIGLTSINLFSDENEKIVDGNIIHGETDVLWANGENGVAGDISFIWDKNNEISNEINDEFGSYKLNVDSNDELFSLNETNPLFTKEAVNDSTVYEQVNNNGLEVLEDEDAFFDTSTKTEASDVSNIEEKDPFDDVTDEELDRSEALARQDMASHEPPEAEAVTVVSEYAQSEGQESMIDEDQKATGTLG